MPASCVLAPIIASYGPNDSGGKVTLNYPRDTVDKDEQTTRVRPCAPSFPLRNS